MTTSGSCAATSVSNRAKPCEVLSPPTPALMTVVPSRPPSIFTQPVNAVMLSPYATIVLSRNSLSAACALTAKTDSYVFCPLSLPSA